MSVINKMLQELDRRNAMAGAEAATPPQQVKVVNPARDHHEWFWRVIALLVLGAVAWVGWVAYQLQPRAPLVSDKALQAQAQARKAAVAAIPPAAAPPAQPPEKPKPAAEPPEMFKLAREIETPIVERKPQPAKAEAPKKVEAPRPVEPAAVKPSVDKRDRGKASEPAEVQFRRAAVLLNQGRVSEAEEQLVGALKADPAHQAARQAYVALLLEQRRMDAAERVLREALQANPTQPTFALALARLYAERRDYPAALDVLDHAGSSAPSADFHALRGAVLQRLGRHAEAVDAYRRAAGSAPQSGSTWAGLAISLEALGRRSEASEAYRHALGAGTLNKDVREYAETRLKALE